MRPSRRPRTSKEERICPFCAQAFNRAEHLARHVRSHTKERPFQCETCSKVYARQDSLVRHGRSHSAGNRSRGESMTDLVPHTLGTPNTRSCQSIPALETGTAVQNAESDGYFDGRPLPRSSRVEDCHSLSLNHSTSEAAPPPMTAAEASIFSQSNHLPITQDSHEGRLMVSRQLENGNNYTSATPPNTLPPTHSYENLSSQFDNSWGFLDPDSGTQWSTWFAGDDFDLDALNDSIITSTASFGYTTEQSPGENAARNFELSSISKPEDLIRRKWFTFSDETPSGYMTPEPIQERTQVDETYRRGLAARLQPQVQSGPLPSTDFLNLCIQAYFTHFHPIFPVIHAPTFQPSTKNAILLLSMCSVGSLLLGSARAAAQGVNVLERLNKAILASWEFHVVHNRRSGPSALQASLIGQTFGLLSGRPRDLVMVEIFHGSVIGWARRLRLFQKVRVEPELDGLSGDPLASAWKEWIEAEEQARIVLGIHIHDAEIARMFHHNPILRQDIERLPVASSNELFAAPTAASWKSLMAKARKQRSATKQSHALHQSLLSRTAMITSQLPDVSDRFLSYAILEAIAASSCESREPLARWRLAAQQCREWLLMWYDKYQKDIGPHEPDSFCLMILWHSTFMSLHADFDRLECACGREGYDVAQENKEYAYEWARSADAKRCILHAILIQRYLESLKLGTEPSIHVPMSLYRTGIVWYCYAHFSAGAESASGLTEEVDFPELRLLGINEKKLLSEASGFQFGRPGSSSLCKVIDLLQRVGHWGVSRRLSSTLVALVEGGQDPLKISL